MRSRRRIRQPSLMMHKHVACAHCRNDWLAHAHCRVSVATHYTHEGLHVPPRTSCRDSAPLPCNHTHEGLQKGNMSFPRLFPTLARDIHRDCASVVAARATLTTWPCINFTVE